MARPSEKTSRVWRHNSFFGHARMMHSQCEMIIHSPTTTAASKGAAIRIQNEVKNLIKTLKERVDD